MAVGAHDGRVSVLSLADGRVVASADAGGLLRAPLSCDPWNNGALWAASHGRRLLCLRFHASSESPAAAAAAAQCSLEEAWGLDVGAAVSAAVAFGTEGEESRLVFCATLGGSLFAVQSGSGKDGGNEGRQALRLLWKAALPAPAFASPVFVPGQAAAVGAGSGPAARGGGVLAATVDGSVLLLAASDGAQLWRAQAGGSLFSAPALASISASPGARGGRGAGADRVACALVATDDSSLLALDLEDGSVACRQQLPVRTVIKTSSLSANAFFVSGLRHRGEITTRSQDLSVIYASRRSQGRVVASAAWDAAPPPWWTASGQEMRPGASDASGGGPASTLPFVLATGAGELLVGAAFPLQLGHPGGSAASLDANHRGSEGAEQREEGSDRPSKRNRSDTEQGLSKAPTAAVLPVASAQLPGQVFGAPAAFAGCVLVGARDDYLHCLVLRRS